MERFPALLSWIWENEKPQVKGALQRMMMEGFLFYSRMGLPRVNEKTWSKSWGKSRKDIIPRVKRERVREKVSAQKLTFEMVTKDYKDEIN